jgi:tetratricopeptide (TPR) repeat protein
MKKIVFMLIGLLLVVGTVSAQKRNVSRAKLKFTAEPQDLQGAKAAILPALEDTTTNRLASTWYLAGDILTTLYFKTTNKDDGETLANLAYTGFNAFLKTDSLDQLPDKKGRIKPKYRNKVLENVKKYKTTFVERGMFFVKKKDNQKALKYLEFHLSLADYPLLKMAGFDKDTLRNTMKYYCGVLSDGLKDNERSKKYFEEVKDLKIKDMDNNFIYKKLAVLYAEEKDTVNLIRILKEGALKFTAETNFALSLVDIYVNKNAMGEASKWIDAAINNDKENALLWNIKAVIIEKDSLDLAIQYYKKAIELKSDYDEPYGKIGRIYYNNALDERNRINAIKDNKKYRAELIKLKEKFKVALPYYEKAYEINSNKRDYMIALRGIYYHLENEKLYKEMDERLKDM